MDCSEDVQHGCGQVVRLVLARVPWRRVLEVRLLSGHDPPQSQLCIVCIFVHRWDIRGLSMTGVG